jgi:glutathione S-transferase
MTNSTPLLFGFAQSTFSQTAALALAEKSVKFSWVQPDLGDTQYRLLHPFAKVPALVHEDVTLCETLAITLYVDETFEGNTLQQAGLSRYKLLQWISIYSDYFVRAILDGSVRERFVKPMFGLTPDEQTIASHMPLMKQCVEILEKQLSQSSFIVGDMLSIADLFYIPTMLYFKTTPEGAKMLKGQRGIDQWLSTMLSRPSVRNTCVQAQ